MSLSYICQTVGCRTGTECSNESECRPTGPGTHLSVSLNNVFGGGESWNVKLKGSYEWQTGGGEKKSLMNSWGNGAFYPLTFPSVVFPHLGKRSLTSRPRRPFRLYIDQLNRQSIINCCPSAAMLHTISSPPYQPAHSITPFKLTFNVLQHQSKILKIAD